MIHSFFLEAFLRGDFDVSFAIRIFFFMKRYLAIFVYIFIFF